MKGYLQLTPIPSHFFENTNVLDRMAKALDGPDPADVRQAWFDGELADYLNWSGLKEGDWRYSQITGFPTKFMVFSGPWAPKGSDASPIAPRLESYLDQISTGAVYGDAGTTLDGKSFSSRAQWVVKPKKVKVERVKGEAPRPGLGVGRPLLITGILSLLVMITLVTWTVING